MPHQKHDSWIFSEASNRRINYESDTMCFLTALASFAAFSQTPPTRVEFEVASVKPSADAGTPMGNVTRGLHIDGAMVSVNGMPLKWYIHYAYTVKEPQVSGPDWLNAERFDVVAKLPAGHARANRSRP